MKHLIALLLLGSTHVFAAGLTPSAYVRVQEALAADDFKTALTAHKDLCTKDAKLLGTYKDCQKPFKGVEELRTSFKALSEVYISQVPSTELKGLIKANCPMASARWIQKEGALRNPYYGKSMLECGEKI